MVNSADKTDMETLRSESRSPAFARFLELYGKQRKNENVGETVMNYGKHKGKTYKEIFDTDLPYIAWFVSQPQTKYNKKAQRYFCERIEQKYENTPPNSEDDEKDEEKVDDLTTSRLM